MLAKSLTLAFQCNLRKKVSHPSFFSLETNVFSLLYNSEPTTLVTNSRSSPAAYPALIQMSLCARGESTPSLNRLNDNHKPPKRSSHVQCQQYAPEDPTPVLRYFWKRVPPESVLGQPSAFSQQLQTPERQKQQRARQPQPNHLCGRAPRELGPGKYHTHTHTSPPGSKLRKAPGGHPGMAPLSRVLVWVS